MLTFASAALSMALLCGTGYVPREDAQSSVHAKSQHHSADLVDINGANLDQLMKVPGVSHIWAERILRFRPYRTKQDLLDDGILPGNIYFRIKDSIVAHRAKR